jgi:hypothetical protein
LSGVPAASRRRKYSRIVLQPIARAPSAFCGAGRLAFAGIDGGDPLRQQVDGDVPGTRVNMSAL